MVKKLPILGKIRGIITSHKCFYPSPFHFQNEIYILALKNQLTPMKLKSILVALATMLTCNLSQAQLKSTPHCPAFHIDILDGTVSKMYPQSPLGDIVNRLPCYTEVIDEMNTGGCGGVYFKDKAVFFHTYRDYIEIKENYTGTISMPLMGTDRTLLFKWLGLPAKKDIRWESYTMRYGSLILFFNEAGKVNSIIITTKNAESLNLCE